MLMLLLGFAPPGEEEWLEKRLAVLLVLGVGLVLVVVVIDWNRLL